MVGGKLNPYAFQFFLLLLLGRVQGLHGTFQKASRRISSPVERGLYGGFRTDFEEGRAR